VRGRVQVRATGGGAFKFADLFREKLGVVLKKEDEIACLVQVCPRPILMHASHACLPVPLDPAAVK
jgi:pantothenate kinase